MAERDEKGQFLPGHAVLGGEETRFKPGNRWWERRASYGPHVGNNRKWEADDLWAAAQEYFTDIEDNPLLEAQAFNCRGEVTVVPLPKMRAMTIKGLCLFLGINARTWTHRRIERPDMPDLTERNDAVIFTQKFEGAAAGMLNPGLIGRDLGLAARSEITGRDGGPLGGPIRIELVAPSSDDSEA